MNSLHRSALLVSALLLPVGLPLGTAHAAPARPVIEGVSVVDAPAGGRGGLMSPYVSCTKESVQPRARMTITSLASGESHTFVWREAAPGMHFPRVAPGRYEVRTTARCRAQRAVLVETVRVREKTRRGTISRAEFVQVRRGMTRAQVRSIVGNDGRDPFTDRGATTRTYDMMAFWRWSIVTYRDGRVVSKQWNVDHD